MPLLISEEVNFIANIVSEILKKSFYIDKEIDYLKMT